MCYVRGFYTQCCVPSEAAGARGGVTHSTQALVCWTWVEISTPLPNLCIMPGMYISCKFLILSKPELTHLQNGNSTLYLTGL